MGEAKRRGTFDQRKAEAKARVTPKDKSPQAGISAVVNRPRVIVRTRDYVERGYRERQLISALLALMAGYSEPPK